MGDLFLLCVCALILYGCPFRFCAIPFKYSIVFDTALRNEFTDCDTFIDLFGGSGLLSHFTHTVFPNAQVIYNDFDHYADRLAHIPDTNALLAELRVILHGYPRYKRITEPYYSRLMQVIEWYDHAGFVDYISLSASLLFSSNYVTDLASLRKEQLYNTLRLTDFNADGYLYGLSITHTDYRQLFA